MDLETLKETARATGQAQTTKMLQDMAGEAAKDRKEARQQPQQQQQQQIIDDVHDCPVRLQCAGAAGVAAISCFADEEVTLRCANLCLIHLLSFRNYNHVPCHQKPHNWV